MKRKDTHGETDVSLAIRWNDLMDLGDMTRFPDCKQRSTLVVETANRYASAHTRILDLGCGCGRDLAALWQAGFRELTGVDVNRQAIALATSLYPDVEMNLRVASLQALPRFERGYFGLAYSFTSLQHIPPCDIEAVVKTICQISRLIFTVENERGTSVNYLWIHDYPALFAARGAELLETSRHKISGEPYPGTYTARVFRSKMP